MSNWAGRLRVDTISRWKAAAIEKVIVRISTERQDLIAITNQQIDSCAAEGLTIEGYLWLYFDPDDPPEAQVARALNAINDPVVQRLWIDCEEDTSRVDDVVDWIRQALFACGAMPTGIYTSAGWWNRWTDTSHELDAYPLWLAQWDGVQELPPGVAMKQYAGDVQLGGVTVDLNVY